MTESVRSVRSEGAKHGTDNMDMLLSKLDAQSMLNQSVYGWPPVPPPPPCPQIPGDSMPPPGFTLQKLPHYPAYLSYPGSSASTRSLLSGYHKKKRCGTSSCACRVAVMIILVLLFVWGVTIPLYFFVGPGKGELFRASETEEAVNLPPEAQISMSRSTFDQQHEYQQPHILGSNPLYRGLTVPNNNTVLSAVNCSAKIVNQLYSPDLEDPKSLEHHMLKLKLETLFALIFQQERSFEKVIVTKFGLGTTVEFIVMMNENRADIMEFVHNLITDYLLSHYLMLGYFQIDLTTLQVNYIQDPCNRNNGGCSHHCYWSLLRIDHICQCPSEYSLSKDDKTCQHIVDTPPRMTADLNPCTSNQFHCHSNGNCIPLTWMCDGVSDCLWDEDESSSCNKRDTDDSSAPLAIIKEEVEPFIDSEEEQQVESLYNMFNTLSGFEELASDGDGDNNEGGGAGLLGYPMSNDVLLGHMNKLKAEYEQSLHYNDVDNRMGDTDAVVAKDNEKNKLKLDHASVIRYSGDK